MQITEPVRAVRTYEQTLNAPPSKVFPLLCPVREREWVDGWDPQLVISASGTAELDCVFVTTSFDREATWVVTDYRPKDGHLEMVEILPGFVVIRLSVALYPLGDDRTRARVTYRYTALSSEGAAFVAARTQAWYEAFMREWEGSLNRYLGS